MTNKELLADVAREVYERVFELYRTSAVGSADVEEVLERRLLPLLEAGQELYDSGRSDSHKSGFTARQDWDTARKKLEVKP